MRSAYRLAAATILSAFAATAVAQQRVTLPITNKEWEQPFPAFKIVGNQITITPPANYVGSFYVEVSVSDGYATTKRTFKVNVTVE